MAATKKFKLAAETDKNKRYDRQLRLWGDHGQADLESAHVCLINATALGTEILKSLILPGIGAFTIVDSNKVTGEDVGNNFFLDVDSIGKSRSKATVKLLLELNSEVRGDSEEEPVENLLEAKSTFFDKFSIVIASNVPEKTLLALAEKLWQEKIPLLVCRSYGMIGYMRLQINEHTVIESHPENDFYDLRLDKPFPALQEFSDAIDLETLSNKDHSHLPFVIILLKYLNRWKEENDGIPKNSKEKNLFKEEIKKGTRVLKDGSDEENFDEAVKAVNRSLSESKVPARIKDLFENESAKNLNSESTPFWIMVEALKEFCDNKGYLPLSGVIPDMTADTDRYINLQKIYKSEAEKNALMVYNSVQKLLAIHGKSPDSISESDVKLFCKNAHNLRIIQGRSLMEEYNNETAKIHDYAASLDDSDSDIIYYVMLRSIDRFFTLNNRYPGLSDDQLESDISKLKCCFTDLIKEWGSGNLSKDDYIHEMCRFGAAELHSVSSFIGGCAAQEVIKIITGQYVPFDNTFVYNAMTCTSSVFNL